MSNTIQPSGELLYSLNERAKELNCLYQVEEILKNLDSDLGEVFKKILDVIPPGWQFPEYCEARIIFDRNYFCRENFLESDIYQYSDLISNDKILGRIQVFYSVGLNVNEGWPFLQEEQKLLNSIAENIANFIFNKKIKSVFGEWEKAEHTLDLLKQNEGRLLKILMNTDVQNIMSYFESPTKGIKSFSDLEKILEPKSDKHWKWRFSIAELITERLSFFSDAKERFGVNEIYLIGSTKNAIAGPGSDIDLIVHFIGSDEQKKELIAWFEGWSLCLSEMNYQMTGYQTEGLIDLHIITDEDIKNRTSWAVKIGAVSDGARKLELKARGKS